MASLSLNIQASKIKQHINIPRKVAGYSVADLSFLTILFFCLIGIQPVHSQSISSAENGNNESINLGLLITEDPAEDPLMGEAVDVVNLVLGQVNESGGIREKQVRLFTKSVDGNWGAGSKRAVSLISEHGVTALLGFVDGRSAHLIEQVCTKAQIPFISTFSPDPTLSRINIPWFFSTIPHADQQAKALAVEITKTLPNNKIAVISSDDYDVDFIKRSFLQSAEEENSYMPNVWSYTTGENNFTQVTSEISESSIDAIVFFGRSGELRNLISEMKLRDVEIPVYTSIMDLKEEWFSESSILIYTIRSKNRDSEQRDGFRKDFFQEYGYWPGVYAPYVYEGTKALLEAIKLNGAESSQIQETLRKLSLQGINGIISFDESGMIVSPLEVVNSK